MTFDPGVLDGDVGGDGRRLSEGQRCEVQLLDVAQSDVLDGRKDGRLDVDDVAVGRREGDGLPAVARHAAALERQVPAPVHVHRRSLLHLSL